jgi:ABC-type dipeptide/oligopeptide/nickel transport system permease component
VFAYLTRRALTLLPILLLMSIIVFALIRMIPGDPIDVMYGGEGMDEMRRAALAREMGLDQPIVVQYGSWLCEPRGVTWATPTGQACRSCS